MICRYCGRQNNDGVRFCSGCGADLSYDAPSPQPQYQVPQQGGYPNGPQNYPNGPQDYPAPQPVNYPAYKAKKTHPVLIVLLIVLVVGVVAAILVPFLVGATSDIRKVKNGHVDLAGYEDVTWGEALGKICRSSSWESERKNSQRWVTYTGEKKSDGNDLTIKFKLSSDRKTFTVEEIQDGSKTMTNDLEIGVAVMQIFNGTYK